MNIIFLSEDPQEADLLKNELAKQSPAIQVDVWDNAQEVSSRIITVDSCDSILLDTSLPREIAIEIVASIRREGKPIGIVALAAMDDKNSSIDLFKAGVDNFVLKRPGYASQLGEALKQAHEKHKTGSAPQAAKSRVLFAGDIQQIRPQLAAFPHLIIEPVSFAPDGLLKLPHSSSLQDAVLVMDAAAAGPHPLAAVKDINLRAPEIPIILLAEHGNEQDAVQAMQAGASDCIIKTEGYIQRLIPAIERELKYRNLILERAALRAREERLRQIVESMPVGVTVIAPKGTFLAVNRAGLKLMGAARLDQIIGKNFVHLLPQEDRAKILEFLSTIGRGVSASVHLDWKGLDGTSSGLELRAVPMRRDAAGTTAALAAIYPPGGLQGAAATGEVDSIQQEEVRKALLESEARLRELQDKGSLERSKFEEVLKQLESRCAAAEEQQAILKNAAAQAEARCKELIHEQKAERASWDLAREGLKGQCAKIENMAESLRSTQAALIETHDAERAAWETKLRELESKGREAEERLTRMSEALSSNGSDWDKARRELEQKAEQAEKARIAMESSLLDTDARCAQLTEALADAQSLHGNATRELEQKFQETENLRTSLEASRQEAEARIAQLAEELNAERAARDSARQEFEQKFQETENLRASLEASRQESEARVAQLSEELNAERAARDSARQEFEQKFQETENLRASLEASRQEAEARIAQLSEALNAERAVRDSARQELEQKSQEIENLRASLDASRQEAEARIAQISEELNAERAAHDSARQEFEQKSQEIENLRASLDASRQEAEARIAQLSDELNAERAARDSARQEFEQKFQETENLRDSLQASLRDMVTRLTQQTEEFHAERGQWSSIRSELEQKHRMSDEQYAASRTALQHAESVLADKMEELNSERTQWDAVRAELHEKLKESENQRLSMQAALDEVKSYLSQQIETHAAERSQWNLARLELEQKCLHHEEQQAAVQTALREAEASHAHRTEQYENQLAQWNALRIEWEQKCQAEVEQKTALSEALQETESRCAQLAEDYEDKCAQLDRALQQQELLQAEQKQMLTELADMNLRYHALSQLSMAGLVMTTLDGRVLNCNDPAARMFGYDGVDEVRSKSGEYQFQIYAFEGALKQRLLDDGKLENVEWSSLTRDGGLIRIQEHSKLIIPASGEEPCVERILTDITRIHRLGEEIRRSRKMESASDIAAATIKSLQELCISFVSRGEILAESAEDGKAVRSIADGMQQDAQRGIKHARQFFAAIQKADRLPEPLDINEVLTNNDILLRNLLGEDIDLQINLLPRLGMVFANRQEFVQLISGLMANSREALPLGGAVIIETSNIEIEPSASGDTPGMQAGIYVRLLVSADGCSVYPERRIGSIRSLVEQMGGVLDTQNNSQSGNVYQIYFPRVEALPSPPPSETGM